MHGVDTGVPQQPTFGLADGADDVCGLLSAAAASRVVLLHICRCCLLGVAEFAGRRQSCLPAQIMPVLRGCDGVVTLALTMARMQALYASAVASVDSTIHGHLSEHLQVESTKPNRGQPFYCDLGTITIDYQLVHHLARDSACFRSECRRGC